jgi:hypothetical protein
MGRRSTRGVPFGTFWLARHASITVRGLTAPPCFDTMTTIAAPRSMVT